MALNIDAAARVRDWRRNMTKSKREKLEGCGTIGKMAVVGVKDRETKHVAAKVVGNTDAETLQGFVRDHVDEFAGRQNIREFDTLDQMAVVSGWLVGKRLRYRDLIARNGLPSRAGSA